jgi:Kef-type K+ transport system membrane component KefB
LIFAQRRSAQSTIDQAPAHRRIYRAAGAATLMTTLVTETPKQRPENVISLLKKVAGYLCLIIATVGIFLLVESCGAKLSAPVAQEIIAGNSAATSNILLRVLIALLVIVITAEIVGVVFRALGQPTVLGEITAGIMLGPSLLGKLAPQATGALLPPQSLPFLGLLSQIGIILYMFGVGLEFEPRLFRNRGHAAVAISHAGILVPFAFGSLLALWLYPQFSSANVSFRNFALFMGAAMSITAFPVLARILMDRGIAKTRMGMMALSCAAVDDITAWCLLAFIIAVVRTQIRSALITILLVGAYIVSVFFIVRPILNRIEEYSEKRPHVREGLVGVLFILLLLSLIVTEAIGIHAIFGAFLFGVLLPRGSKIAKKMAKPVDYFVTVVLLPAYFAFTGMRTQISLIQSVQGLIACGAVIAVACLGKLGGTTIAARLSGVQWREAASLGALMNTRGLMELVVINIGFDLHVISRTMYALLVVMALVTTVATVPILKMLNYKMPVEDQEPNNEPIVMPVKAFEL